jgi:hypothetical protein
LAIDGRAPRRDTDGRRRLSAGVAASPVAIMISIDLAVAVPGAIMVAAVPVAADAVDAAGTRREARMRQGLGGKGEGGQTGSCSKGVTYHRRHGCHGRTSLSPACRACSLGMCIAEPNHTRFPVKLTRGGGGVDVAALPRAGKALYPPQPVGP